MEVIFENHWGGLGDWLSISHLPEQLTLQKGYDVYLQENAVFRNEGIKELILKNPYIKGVKSGQTNVGDVPGLTPAYQNLTGQHIVNWSVVHGLEPMTTHPKIYYTPTLIEDHQNVLLVDLTSITEQYTSNRVQEAVDLLKESRFLNHSLVYVSFVKALNSAEKDRFHGGRHEDYGTAHKTNIWYIDNIFEYCDVLASVSGFISLHSGAHTLAAAIKNQFNSTLDNVCIIRKSNYDNCFKNGLFIFDNVEYAIVLDT
jgi:hypothetical protein